MIRNILEKTEGMTTVEVSVLVPILSLGAAGVCFLFIFFIDISAAKSETMRIANETAAAWKTDGELADGSYQADTLLDREIGFLLKGRRGILTGKAEKRMTGRVKQRMSAAKIKESTVTMHMQIIKANTEIYFLWPLSGIEEVLGAPMTFSCTSVSSMDNWQEELRRKEAGLKWK